MKVLALNSSPRSQGQSKTELMLSHLVEGMKKAGAEVEIVNLREKKIKPCTGCFACWTKTPGICIHKDDMSAELFDKYRRSDMSVFASPLYHYSLNSVMKKFIERTLPMNEPFFVKHQGRTHHPVRYPYPKTVILSVAGFHEPEIFGPLSAWANYVYKDVLAAEIYRPGAEAMAAARHGKKVKEILAATVKAGKELTETGRISSETLDKVGRQSIGDLDNWSVVANLVWKTCIAEGITIKEFEERKIVPRPDDIQSFMQIMAMAFNPEAAGQIKACIRFVFSGGVAGCCHLAIENGRVQGHAGDPETADLTVYTPFETWMDILTGKADGSALFLENKYRAEGDIDLLADLGRIFARP
ncbi:MAG: NAD(P)H-dependent oxidoreductase [Desulfobacterales bacterium]|nr:NAD(P)H-dependent oxidoreductase [Desulfobacterales bacterium]